MKKFFLSTLMVVGLFLTTASAGFINTGGYTCDPETSAPGTCFYVPETGDRAAAPAAETDYLQIIKTFIKIKLFLPIN